VNYETSRKAPVAPGGRALLLFVICMPAPKPWRRRVIEVRHWLHCLHLCFSTSLPMCYSREN
jgi:hypothetical protein